MNLRQTMKEERQLTTNWMADETFVKKSEIYTIPVVNIDFKIEQY